MVKKKKMIKVHKVEVVRWRGRWPIVEVSRKTTYINPKKYKKKYFSFLTRLGSVWKSELILERAAFYCDSKTGDLLYISDYAYQQIRRAAYFRR